MKLISATVKVTRDILTSATFSPRATIQKEVLHRLRKVFEEACGHSVKDETWNTLKSYVVETSTLYNVDFDSWTIKAQMLVPEEQELFKEPKDV